MVNKYILDLFNQTSCLISFQNFTKLFVFQKNIERVYDTLISNVYTKSITKKINFVSSD